MAYKALYRVHRPHTFDEVVGQEHITDILKKQVENNLVSHAYIFSGPRGTGKTSTARILANAVNCMHPVGGNPCLTCDVCLSAANDTFIDTVEMDAASNNSVDNIRDVREKVNLLPAAGRYKVYIIDEVHMLSGGAFNALLKTLEEPPAHAVFILATTELRKLPKTILSRCQQFDFKRIVPEDIEDRLAKVAAASGISYELGALRMIARASEGALRDALSLMDMCIAGGRDLTEANVYRTVGTAGSEQLGRLGDALTATDTKLLLTLLHSMLKEGGEASNILRDIIAELSGRLMAAAAEPMNARKLLRALEVLIGAQSLMRYSATPVVVLETALLRAALPETDRDTKDLELRIARLEEKIEAIERGGGNIEMKAPQKQSSIPVAEERKNIKAELDDAMQHVMAEEKSEEESFSDIEKKMMQMFGKDKVVIKD